MVKANIIGLVAVLALVLVLLTACANQSTAPVSSPTPAINTPAAADSGKVKFSDSPDSKNAFLISGDALDADAKAAMAGFDMKKTVLADGSFQITLTSTNPEYKDQSYTLKQGEKLYFIERFMGDDVGTEEKNLKDDIAIIVDADGYIVN